VNKKEYMKKYYEDNKEAYRAKNQKWHEENKDKRKNDKLFSRYNLTLEAYKTMFDDQNGCCAICRKHQVEVVKTLCVDHDHITGKVRALLCDDCNKGLGQFKDNPELLEVAAKYLKEFI
jgi:hypothetical protein